MKTNILILIFLLAFAVVSAQTIDWEENQLNGNNAPFYFGGFPRVSVEFADIDADGDYDCFIGSSDEKIAFFENINNNSSPAWNLVTLNYINFEALTLDRMKVRFVDIDSDDDLDLFIGGDFSPLENRRRLLFYKNVGTKYNAAWELVPNFLVNLEAGESSAFCYPAFVDIDNDDDYDLIYGNYKGYCILYENTGNKYYYNFTKKNPNFFGLSRFSNCPNIDFAHIDGDSDLDALVGTHYKLNLITNIGTIGSANWQNDSEHYLDAYFGTYFSPTFADLDNNNNPEIYVGTNNGTIWRFDSIQQNWAKYPDLFFDEGDHLNPEFADLNGDSKMEMIIPNYSSILIYSNLKNNDSVIWQSIPDTLFINYPYSPDFLNRVAFADIDSDNDLDLIISFEMNPQILLYKNTGNVNAPVFNNEFEVIAQFQESQLIKLYPILVDYDNDSDLDIIISAQDGTTNSYPWVDFFENTGNSHSYNWEYAFSKIIAYGSVCCVDEDNDNDLDLMFGFMNRVYLARNKGSINEPVFEEYQLSRKLELANQDISGITTTDLNNDGKNDLVIGTQNGGLLRYDNKGYLDNIINIAQEKIALFPNPTDGKINISGLDFSNSDINFSLFDNESKLLLKFKIDNSRVSLPSYNSGIYFYKITQDKEVIKTGKILISER